MIQLFDRVVLNQNIPKKKLEKGDVGTVVMIHGEREGYEVKFYMLEGETYAVETL